MEDTYLIWSNEHRAWWRPSSRGYTMHLKAAGRYARDEAMKICRVSRDGFADGGIPPEVPIREIDVMDIVYR